MNQQTEVSARPNGGRVRGGPLREITNVWFDPASIPPLDVLTLECGHEIRTVHRVRTEHPKRSSCPFCRDGVPAGGEAPTLPLGEPEFAEVDERPFVDPFAPVTPPLDIAALLRMGLEEFTVTVEGRRLSVKVLA